MNTNLSKIAKVKVIQLCMVFLRCCHKNHSKTDLQYTARKNMCQHLFAYFFDYSIKNNVILFAKRLKKPQEPVISLIPVGQKLF